jgi:hypothetical protein
MAKAHAVIIHSDNDMKIIYTFALFKNIKKAEDAVKFYKSDKFYSTMFITTQEVTIK